MKDIFLDTNLAKNLHNPMDEGYLEFINWLQAEGCLVMSNKLRAEFCRGNQNLAVTINFLLMKGRINMISNKNLKALEFPKKTSKKFRSNYLDLVHIKSIVLSNRKMGLVEDVKLLFDINGLPKFQKIQPTAADHPSKLNYK